MAGESQNQNTNSINGPIRFDNPKNNEAANIYVHNEPPDVKQYVKSAESDGIGDVFKIETVDDNERQIEGNTDRVDSADVLEKLLSPNADPVKQELDIGLTVLQPPDMHYMLQPIKPEPVDAALQSNSVGLSRHKSSHNWTGEQHDTSSKRYSERTAHSKEE